MTPTQKLGWIVDLDGCLASDEVRRRASGPGGELQDYVPEYDSRLDWDTYFKFDLMVDDGVNEHLARAVNIAHGAGVSIVYLTGRPERTRLATELWLKNASLDFHEHLVMRADDDRTAAQKYKTKKIEMLINEYNYKFVLGVTDRICDILAYEHHNIPGLLVRAYEAG